VNTNETQDYEIPADWDVTVQGYYRQGYRAGIEAMRDAVTDAAEPGNDLLWQLDDIADKLLKGAGDER